MPIHLVGKLELFLEQLPFPADHTPRHWETLLIPLFFSTHANQPRVLHYPSPCQCYNYHFRFSSDPRRESTPIQQLEQSLTFHFVDWPKTHIPFFIPITTPIRQFSPGVTTGLVYFIPASSSIVQLTAPAA